MFLDNMFHGIFNDIEIGIDLSLKEDSRSIGPKACGYVQLSLS